MNNGVLIAMILCCFLSVSGGIGGGLYWKRCDIGLVDCPAPAEKEPEKIPGCTDLDANNTSPEANEDDGSCLYDRKAVMKFTANDGTPGCWKTTDAYNFIQAECSPELEQFELDVITNSVGDITDVKTCFYLYGFGGSATWYRSVANNETDECLKYKSGGEDSPDTIDDSPVFADGTNADAGSLLFVYSENRNGYVPVPIKLHLIPQ